MAEIRQLTLRGATGKHRMAVFEGRDYIVVPVVALVEGVIQALNAPVPEFVPAESFSAAPSGWNGRPVMHNHPTVNGVPVSANSPEILEAAALGRIFNTGVSNKQLEMEGWVDLSKASSIGGAAQGTVDRILDGKPIEVSVGAFVVTEARSGVFKGKAYSAVWDEIVPDHLAFLEEGHVGACSNTMGCGTRAAAVHLLTAEGIEPMSEAAPKRSLRERLQGILPFKAGIKGYSDVDVRDALRSVVTASEPLFAYIEAVFESDHYFVYCTMPSDPNSYDVTYFKRSFSLNKTTGVVTLDGDRVQVEPVLYFEPTVAEGQQRAACSCQHHAAVAETQTPSETDQKIMDRKDRIQALIANAKCVIKTPAALEALTDDELTAIETQLTVPEPVPAAVPAPVPAVAAAAPVPVPAPEPKTEAQWLEEAPANVREMIARHAARDAEIKKSLIEAIKPAQKTYDEVKLQAMSIQQLSEISDLLKLEAPRAAVDFSARNPLPRAAAGEDYTPPDPYAPKAAK